MILRDNMNICFNSTNHSLRYLKKNSLIRKLEYKNITVFLPIKQLDVEAFNYLCENGYTVIAPYTFASHKGYKICNGAKYNYMFQDNQVAYLISIDGLYTLMHYE